MVPLKAWDLLSKAEIVLRNQPDSAWLPLRRQGQGIQSLSVIFLFHAFVEHLLQELYEPDSEAVLALEEPETHLHPQAARTLWTHVRDLPGQKIVTTHSPYFVQHVPFRDLRVVRLTANGTEVRSLPASFATTIPPLDGLDDVVHQSNGHSFTTTQFRRSSRSTARLTRRGIGRSFGVAARTSGAPRSQPRSETCGIGRSSTSTTASFSRSRPSHDGCGARCFSPDGG